MISLFNNTACDSIGWFDYKPRAIVDNVACAAKAKVIEVEHNNI